MPHVITTTRPERSGGAHPGEYWHAPEAVSSRAVATLEEARTAFTDFVTRVAGDDPPALAPVLHMIRVWSGDVPISLGPLPDGSTIEVEPITWPRLATLGGIGGNYRQLIDAYNARAAGEERSST